ncbi:hypothetical protein TYRP_005509 [Tyrophagus putrescentiae]|nr:hypothetical protein TYRP_005509 [Tyrophagus putrescentiae]
MPSIARLGEEEALQLAGVAERTGSNRARYVGEKEIFKKDDFYVTTTTTSSSKRRIAGVIAYVSNPFHLKPSENDWCGVVLDESLVMNNGTVQSNAYFAPAPTTTASCFHAVNDVFLLLHCLLH